MNEHLFVVMPRTLLPDLFGPWASDWLTSARYSAGAPRDSKMLLATLSILVCSSQANLILDLYQY